MVSGQTLGNNFFIFLPLLKILFGVVISSFRTGKTVAVIDLCRYFPKGMLYCEVRAKFFVQDLAKEADIKQVDVFHYLKTRHLCVLLNYLKLPLV